MRVSCKECKREFELEISQERWDWLHGFVELPEDEGKNFDEWSHHAHIYCRRNLSPDTYEIKISELCCACYESMWSRLYPNIKLHRFHRWPETWWDFLANKFPEQVDKQD